MNFTNDEMNLMCIYSAEGNRTELMEKLAEMKFGKRRGGTADAYRFDAGKAGRIERCRI